MIEFRITADNNCIDVRIDGRSVGSLQRHPENPPQFVTGPPLRSITLTQLEKIYKKLQDYAQAPAS